MKRIVRQVFHVLLTHIIWTIAAFIGYSFIGPGDRPTLLGSLVALVIILPSTFYLGKFIGRTKSTNTFFYPAYLAIGVFVINLLITIPNETTKVFLGSWAVYLTFLGIYVGTYLGITKNH